MYDEKVKDVNNEESSSKVTLEELKKKYANTKTYLITTSVGIDDEEEKDFTFLFSKPKTQSYDRYIKTASSSSSKALRVFILDNVVPEQKEEIREHLEEYPAASISIGEKLLSMLGLSKETSVKKL